MKKHFGEKINKKEAKEMLDRVDDDGKYIITLICFDNKYSTEGRVNLERVLLSL